MPHDHLHDHEDLISKVPSDPALRVKALESLLVETGLVDPAAVDAWIETFEKRVGPHNGARVVARGMERSRFQATAPRRCVRPAQGDGAPGHAGAAHGGGREHADGPQPRRLHAVLLLSLAAARAAAALVQVGALPLARGDRSARRAARVRRRARPRRRGAGLGQHRGDPLPGPARATRRHRRTERGRAGGAGDARRHDRRRA